ncbi:FAD-dependent monooxygenase [Kitasatospora sp. NPDC048540]|uniref:FAD-dependent monooxygenase n=1 Tax=unclassified Kitasatospora TaxID=2633591 RepID=UPI00053A357E|nr:FAD-dependent monooxygenase [Kitasatospora sp. MBT63]
MGHTDILISGGGIAGPALAYWLHRAGFAVTVVERAPAPRPGGQTVDLRGAGRTVIERMGLMPQARELSVQQHGFVLVDAADRITARVGADSFGGEGIISEIEILRGDLGQLLYEATRPHVEYLFDDTITSLDQDEDGVSVGFERGGRRRFGLVVGADGLHSVVRSLAFGPQAGSVRPIGIYNAWFTMQGGTDLGGWFRMFNAPGGLVASARPGRHPGEIKAGLGFRSPPLDYDRRDLDAQRALVADRFAGVGWLVPELLAAMRTAEDFAFDPMGQVHLDSWHRGRTVLLGDAGYCATPLTGLGTSLALVGAYVLAGELAGAGTDPQGALRRYDAVMRPYVRKAQELPPGGAGGFAPSSALAIRLRAASMRSMNRWPVRNLMAAQFAKAGDIALPHYPELN